MQLLDWDRLSRLVKDKRLWIASVPLAVVLFLLWMGLGAFSVTICAAALLAGSQLANWATLNSNLQSWLVFGRLWKLPMTEDSKKVNKDGAAEEKRKKMPWEDIFIPTDLNESLENLLDQLVDQYVNNWYSSGIGHDRAFLNEIRYQLRYGCSTLVQHLINVDLSTIVSKEAIPALSLHMHKIMNITNKFDEKNLPLPLAENKICEKLNDLHYAMRSRSTELNYLRQVADVLIPLLLDESRLSGRAHDDDGPITKGLRFSTRVWPSHSARHILRELLVNAILIPLLDMIADPDCLNSIIITYLDSLASAPSYDIKTDKVIFLRGLSDVTNDSVPDSLLQLKLSDIIRDSRSFEIFKMYLKDIRGPVHELQFLSEANRIHVSMQNKSEEDKQISYDIWQLYLQFVHEGASDQIVFDDDIVEDFKTTIEQKDKTQWDRVIEKSYQIVYQRMQINYVIPFCQSDAFLGHLCGSPPISVIELIEKPVQRKVSTSGSVLSFNMFRTQIRRLLTMSTDGYTDGDEANEEYSMHDMNSMNQLDSDYDSSSFNSYRDYDDPSLRRPSGEIPEIDISEDLVSEPSESSPNPEDDEISSGGSAPEVAPQPQLMIDNITKNINKWKVGISRVIPRKDAVTGRTIFVFVIDVERMEAGETETKCWSIYRRFTEFYVLEAKLMEFHREALKFTALPARKTFVTKNRAYMEQHRLIFSAFISSLCKQRLLSRSDLLFTFLTSPEEFRDSLMLSDLNPWKVVKKMPGKLSREKGQHLRPFLLNLLANTLAPVDNKQTFKEKVDVNSESSSISSNCVMADNVPSTMYSSIYGNNCVGCQFTDDNVCIESWSKSAFDALLLLFYSAFSPLSTMLFNFLASIRLLFCSTFDKACDSLFSHIFTKICADGSLVALVQLTQQMLFYSDAQPATAQEKSLREDLVKRRVKDFLEENLPNHVLRAVGRVQLRSGADHLLACLQYPRLNKQLSYVLLDILISHLIPSSH